MYQLVIVCCIEIIPSGVEKGKVYSFRKLMSVWLSSLKSIETCSFTTCYGRWESHVSQHAMKGRLILENNKILITCHTEITISFLEDLFFSNTAIKILYHFSNAFIAIKREGNNKNRLGRTDNNWDIWKRMYCFQGRKRTVCRSVSQTFVLTCYCVMDKSWFNRVATVFVVLKLILTRFRQFKPVLIIVLVKINFDTSKLLPCIE